MRVRILGENSPFPAPGGATIGCLVDTGEGCFTIDCGSGVLAELLRHVSLRDLQAVVVTHYHADHVADLGVLQYAMMTARMTGERTAPFPVYANDNPPEKFAQVPFRKDVEAMPVNARTVLQLCGATVRFCDTAHAVPCLAVAVEKDGKKFVFSADTGPSRNVEQFAAGADLFLCEATWRVKDQGPAAAGHLTTRQAGEMAARAGVKKLCLTHIYPGYDRQELKREAATAFTGEILVAEKGMVLEV